MNVHTHQTLTGEMDDKRSDQSLTCFQPTPEQRNLTNLIISSPSTNVLVESLPGTGKTTSLISSVEHLRVNRILCLAFNTRIRDAMVLKYEERSRETPLPPLTERYNETGAAIKTVNSLGFKVWLNTCGEKVIVNLNKMKEIVQNEIKTLRTKAAQAEAWEQTSEIYAAIRLARACGYVPPGAIFNSKGLTDQDTLYAKLDETPTDLVEDILEQSLLTSIKYAYRGNIDLEDQIYMSALFGGGYPKYDAVLVDEAQDLNRCMHEMLWKMRKARIIAFGDDNQSIYAFNGAVNGGMDKMAQRFNMTRVPLTHSFRCPEAIVKNSWWRAPQMRWVKTGGYAGELKTPGLDTFVDDSAIICRNNAPLFALAFRLLAAGRNVTVAGSDIGNRVVGIMRKLGSESLTREALLIVIEQWRQEKLARESKTANDVADCMVVFANKGETLGDALLFAEALFKRKGPLTLITGHKAKGLEWSVVYHLDPHLIKWEASDQEANLRFVIQTRALDSYYELNSAEIVWP